MQFAITVVLKLGHFSPFSVFLDFRKAPEPSTNVPATPTAPNHTPSTETPDIPNPPSDKYIVAMSFYLNYFPLVARYFVQSTKLCCSYYPQSSRHPSRHRQNI